MSKVLPSRFSCALLVGGLATRLKPITTRLPKCLVEVAGRPFLEHQFAHLLRCGIRSVVLCTGHLGEMVREFAGDGSRFGLDVTYSPDGEQPLGTGGAIFQALPLLSDPFFVLYGDSYLPIPFEEVAARFLRDEALGCMTVFHNADRWDKSNVWFEEERIRLYSKMTPDRRMDHIDYGLGLLRHSVFAHAPATKKFDLAVLYENLVKAGLLQGQEVFERFYEIGSHAGLQELSAFLLRLPNPKKPQQFVNYSIQHLNETIEIARRIDPSACERAVEILLSVRKAEGRLFILGVGGSAANASHAVNDFRKIAGIEAYAPTDNVSELTARTNDEGWESVFVEWLRGSRLRPEDCLLILSVGGGDMEKNISPNLVRALKFCKQVGAKVVGIVGRDGGYTAKVADVAVLVPAVYSETITPHSEAFQAIIWHLLVSHPSLKVAQTKWESAE